jgi:hypothetical protein
MPRIKGGWLEFDMSGERPGGGNRPSGGNRPGGGVDPDWGIDEGGRPDNELPGSGNRPDNSLPDPPPGVWPGPTPSHPIVPVPPDEPTEPGTIWPPAPGNATGKFWVVAGIPGHGWRYVCIDIGLRPDNELPGGGGEHPDQGLPPSTMPPIAPGGQPQPKPSQQRR